MEAGHDSEAVTLYHSTEHSKNVTEREANSLPYDQTGGAPDHSVKHQFAGLLSKAGKHNF